VVSSLVALLLYCTMAAAAHKHHTFPIAVQMSLHDGGMLHAWERSFDAKSVSPRKRITVTLNASDLIVFHGALVHEDAGYRTHGGDAVHIRLHFYTESTSDTDLWAIANQTEEVPITA
jgi:hypothetical protein